MFNFSKLEIGVSLAEYTTFKIGGKAKYFFIGKNKDDIMKAIKWAAENNEKIFILGGGSNVLFSDKGFQGLVIKMNFSDDILIKETGVSQHQNFDLGGKEKGVIVSVGSGCALSKLIEFLRGHSLTGMEWAAGIPGTLGGAIRGNAEAFGESVGDLVKVVNVLKIPEKGKGAKLISLAKEDCGFNYRTSVFQKKKNYIIISAELEFKKENKEVIEKKIKNNITFRSLKQPLGYPNAGSIFKNVRCAGLEECNNLIKSAQMARSSANRGAQIKDKRDDEALGRFKKMGVIPAGYFIEECGLKGKKSGGAMISLTHANIIVNFNNAKAKDVIHLMDAAKRKVNEKFGVRLENEIEVAQ